MIQSKPSRGTRRGPFPPVLAAFSAIVLAACSSSGGGDGLETVSETSAAAGSNFASLGEPAATCPKATVRDGTSILDRRKDEQSSFNANIIDVQTTCRRVENQLRMRVAVAGRVVPGPSAPGAVQLPIRVVVLRGEDVIYSELGQANSRATYGQPAETFTYVDERIAFAVPDGEEISVFTGFDEGPPE